jgi:hypothetical protein
MNECIAKLGVLPIFPAAPGKRVWRPELHQPPDWRPGPDEKKFGPKTDLPDGIYVVTVSENTPAERIELFLKASFAARHSGYHFALGDDYDAAVAVFSGRIVGIAWADTLRVCQFQYRFESKPHRKFVSSLTPRPTVMGIWVNPRYRRLTIGRQIISAVGQHFSVQVEEIGSAARRSSSATNSGTISSATRAANRRQSAASKRWLTQDS